MKGILGVAIGGIFLMGAGGAFAAPPGPGQHFNCSDGGSGVNCAADDGGCVSNTKNHLKCSDSEAKAFSKAIAAVGKCHIKQADAAFKTNNGKPTTFDEEGCENAAITKLSTTRAKIEGSGICDPTQINNFNVEQAVLFGHPPPAPALSVDGQNGNTYCDSASGVLIDPSGDDTGFVPNSKDNLKCADTVVKIQSKLVAAVIKCHIKLNDSDFKGKDFDEESCEETNPSQKGALDKYNQQRDKLKGLGICPSCLCESPSACSGIDARATSILGQADGANGLAYPCNLGSPSGAFIDPLY
jgi:hypothetical protein